MPHKNKKGGREKKSLAHRDHQCKLELKKKGKKGGGEKGPGKVGHARESRKKRHNRSAAFPRKKRDGKVKGERKKMTKRNQKLVAGHSQGSANAGRRGGHLWGAKCPRERAWGKYHTQISRGLDS